jgi:hypothetical protein
MKDFHDGCVQLRLDNLIEVCNELEEKIPGNSLEDLERWTVEQTPVLEEYLIGLGVQPRFRLVVVGAEDGAPYITTLYLRGDEDVETALEWADFCSTAVDELSDDGRPAREKETEAQREPTVEERFDAAYAKLHEVFDELRQTYPKDVTLEQRKEAAAILNGALSDYLDALGLPSRFLVQVKGTDGDCRIQVLVDADDEEIYQALYEGDVAVVKGKLPATPRSKTLQQILKEEP